MKIVATIEARMTSSRLPGKVLLEARGKSMLSRLVKRLRAVPSIDQIVLATTVNVSDDVLEQFARKENIGVHRGSEDNVMERVMHAAAEHGADIIVEITGDCPIIDPNIVEQTIQLFLMNPCDYASNGHHRSFPDGMDVQVFWLTTLQKSYEMTQDPLDREHVTLHIRNHPEVFRHCHLPAPCEIHWPELGLTLDEPADYRLLTAVIDELEPENELFTCSDVVRFLRQNEWLIEINHHVLRKGDS